MKILKKVLSTFLVVLICLTAAQFDGFVNIKLPEFNISDRLELIGDVFSLKASAATEGYYTYTISNNYASITDVNTSISGYVTIPSTLGGYPLTTISDYAFDNCSNLTRITLPESVTTIGKYAFRYCENLRSIVIPDGVKQINKGTFYYCHNLASVTIPDSVTSIGDDAFDNCYKLESIKLPDNLRTIGRQAFYACHGLTSITIPKNVTTIGIEPFIGCGKLLNINVDKNNRYFSNDEYGVLFNKNKTNLIKYPQGNTSIEYNIPESVTTISDSAFRGSGYLESISIPKGITKISDECFGYCSNLKNVVIPDNVYSIGDFSFTNCYNLVNIVIPSKVTSISVGAFNECSNLTSIVISDSVTSIERSAFDDCDNLADVYYTGTNDQWAKISIARYNTSLINAKIYYNYNVEIFPDGYDFDEDRYSFRNIDIADTISLDIYKDVFGEEKGETIYNTYERGNSSHGLCYGIAVTTGSLLLDVPRVGSFIRYVGPCKYIKNINIGTKCYELNTITAKNFIKYGYVTQFSTQAETEFGDCTALYNAVSDYVYNGGIPVTISLKEYRYDSGENKWSQSFGHRVLAVGIDGDNGIIIDDSNKNSQQTIYLTKDSNGNFTNEWTYSGYSQTTNGTCAFDEDVGVARVIGYNTAIALPYLVLAANAQLDGYPDSAYEDEYHEVDIETTKLDSEYNLVSVISDSYEIVSDDGYLSAIDKPEMGSEISDNNGDLYWINDSSNITVSTFNSDDNKVKFATNDVAVEVSVYKDSTVDMSIDKNSNSVIANLSIVEGKDYTITFDTSDSEGNDVDISVTGIANGDEVTATETEDGIQVTGLNDITVTYETPDGTAETTAKVDDGSTVNIIVNDDENTVETDWQCKHPDDNHDGICDSCSEDFTKSCDCMCHSNAFLQFIHKIICFVFRIFGMNEYQVCDCGKAHW